MENPTYQVQVRYAVEFVKQLLPQVDAATSLLLIGDLSQCRLDKLEEAVREPIAVDNPIFSESYGRLAIPLSGLNKFQLKKHLLHRLGIRSLITDVQLERYGRLLLHAPASFKHGATLSDWFRPNFVQDLVNDGIITITQSGIRATTTVEKSQAGFQFSFR